MSLTSLLLGSNAKIDTDLDNLFDVQVPNAAPATKTEARKKRKIASTDKDSVTNTPKKRARPDTQQGGKTKQREIEHETENDDDPDTQTDEGDNTIPLHESLAKSTNQREKVAKRKQIPEDETPEMRDRRTIFVGNLPLEVLSKKLLKKQLQRHILSFVPTGRIESTRFRSIPFQVPTAKLQDSDDEGDSKTSNRDARTHAKQRTSNWRANQSDKGEEGVKSDEKKYLTPAQKKKIAYINQEFHTTADVVNAYLVFAHPKDAAERPANLPPLPPTMNPYQAAHAAVEANGSLFMDRVLRVDLVGKGKTVCKAREDEPISSQGGDPRLSIFVGSLDFATKEEDLRAFFEGLMCTERGSPGQSSADETSNPDLMRKPLTWVTRIRIVRDNATQLGRGFAYVEFMDQECVDEILAMEESKLKFAKRKLRVQRCKTVPGKGVKHLAPQKRPATKTSAEKLGRLVRPKGVDEIPKGDPFLGEKLLGLSKEERKQRKSTNLDRLARRLAKKKLRMAMGPTVGNALRKERSRVRSKVKRS